MLVGSAELMARARLYRKALGGGMRQAGILAAAGLIALEQGPSRLHEDHANARLLAEALSNIEHVEIDVDAVETNIVIFRLTGGLSAAELSARLKARDILANAVGPDAMRLVTHLDVDREACVTAAEALAEEIEALAKMPRFLSRATNSGAPFLALSRKITMLVSTSLRRISTPSMAARASASKRALAWSSWSLSGPCSSATSPAAARMPAWRMPPPRALRYIRARSMSLADPTSIDPTGAPSPFDRQNITVSKPLVKLRTSSPSAVAALKMRAPSR